MHPRAVIKEENEKCEPKEDKYKGIKRGWSVLAHGVDITAMPCKHVGKFELFSECYLAHDYLHVFMFVVMSLVLRGIV